jgi:hypothetical protein
MEKKTWEEFRETGLLWFVNTTLHAFGWVICIEKDKGMIIDVFPARIHARGFSEQSNTNGYRKITHYLKEHIDELVDDVHKDDGHPF